MKRGESEGQSRTGTLQRRPNATWETFASPGSKQGSDPERDGSAAYTLYAITLRGAIHHA